MPSSLIDSSEKYVLTKTPKYNIQGVSFINNNSILMNSVKNNSIYRIIIALIYQKILGKKSFHYPYI